MKMIYYNFYLLLTYSCLHKTEMFFKSLKWLDFFVNDNRGCTWQSKAKLWKGRRL